MDKIKKDSIEDTLEKNNQEIIFGRQPILELLKAGKSINKILLADNEKKGSILQLIALAKEQKIIIQEKNKKFLDNLCNNANHQGIVAYIPPFEYANLEETLLLAKRKNEEPLLLLLDSIQDPHNVGALLRSAEAMGVHGVLLPKRRSCPLTAAVAKASTGALEHVPVIRIGNVVQTINMLKKEGFWVIGADLKGEKEIYNADLKGALLLIIGSEGEGIGHLIKENCDFLVKIPMKGKVNSLNASVAGAIILFEAMKQRS